MWLHDAKRKGLTFYVSDKTIGTVSFVESSWFTGIDERFFFAKGAYYQAVHPRTLPLWMAYFAWRTQKMCNMSRKEKMKWMKHGICGYRQMLGFEDYKARNGL